MNYIKIKFLIGIMSFGLITTLISCNDDLDEVNINLNEPEIVPTNTIFNSATRYLMYNTRDEWWSGRLTLPWMQYSAQYIYVEEDKYQYRETQSDNAWTYMYRSAQNFKSIIDFCENPETVAQMSGYGNIDNQIAVSRIMLAYTFDQLASHFGDVPYWSYGDRENPNFQALQILTYFQPKYASQQDIYADILKELKEASAQLVLDESVFISGDNIYNGDASKWKKFANSLRLRIANRIKAVYPEASSHISDAIASGVFTSNDDSAIQAFFSSSVEASPYWSAFFVDNRTDFAVNAQFVNLLKGETGNFGLDPRLQKMVAPIGLTREQVTNGSYSETDDLSQYIGMPYGLPGDRTNANGNLEDTSFVSSFVLSPTYGEPLMEYSEVEFILSELNNWDQGHYENGVRASMEKWGVSTSDINSYIASLPSANQENVLSQKYISLYMQGAEAWNDYRRTGYPNTSILLLPGETSYELDGTPYVFTPLISGSVIATDIPYRVRYPQSEYSTNTSSIQAAVESLSHGDEIDSKLWWDVN